MDKNKIVRQALDNETWILAPLFGQIEEEYLGNGIDLFRFMEGAVELDEAERERLRGALVDIADRLRRVADQIPQ